MKTKEEANKIPQIEINYQNKFQSEIQFNINPALEYKIKLESNAKSKSSRYIPVAIKQDLFKRAQGCCEYVNHQGDRCTNRYQLEIDHAVIPFSHGGEHTLENLILACSNHNSYRAHKMGIGYETTNQFVY